MAALEKSVAGADINEMGLRNAAGRLEDMHRRVQENREDMSNLERRELRPAEQARDDMASKFDIAIS